MTLVYITCKDNEEAKKIAAYLLEKRLIACANIFPIKSMYWWEGKINDNEEVVLLGKTNDKNFEKIKQEVKKIHSYDIPCIMKLDSVTNNSYQTWVNENID